MPEVEEETLTTGTADETPEQKQQRRLRNKRKTVRKAITEKSKKLTDLQRKDRSPDVLIDLEALKIAAEELCEDEKKYTLEYHAVLSTADIDRDLPKCREYQDKARRIIAGCSFILRTSSSTASAQTVTVQSTKSSLPEVEILVFHGEYRKWPQWIETFDALVHNNPHLENIIKFSHLRSKTAGDAFNVVDSHKFTSNDYQAAYDGLHSWFNKPFEICSSLIEELIAHPQVGSKSTGKDLRLLYETLRSTISILERYEYKRQYNAVVIVSIVRWKLTRRLRREWILHLDKEKEEDQEAEKSKLLSLFLAFLESQAKAEESSTVSSQFTRADRKEVKEEEKRSKFKKKKDKSSAFKTTSSSVQCIWCNKEHKTVDCDNFPASPKEAFDKVQKARGCNCCLSRDHTVNYCPDKQPCGVDNCDKFHHQLLHFAKAKKN